MVMKEDGHERGRLLKWTVVKVDVSPKIIRWNKTAQVSLFHMAGFGSTAEKHKMSENCLENYFKIPNFSQSFRYTNIVRIFWHFCTCETKNPILKKLSDMSSCNCLLKFWMKKAKSFWWRTKANGPLDDSGRSNEWIYREDLSRRW